MKQRRAQLLVETIIGLGFLSLILAAVVPLFMVGTQGPEQAWKKDAASNLAQEMIAGLKASKDENWNSIYRPAGTESKGQDNPYHLVLEAGKWILSAGAEEVSLNGATFSRQIIIDNVSRTGANGAGEIEQVFEPAREDPSTQKITIQVAADNSSPIKLEEYLTRYKNSVYEQTDWSGSSGQKDWQEGSNSFFSSSQIDNTQASQIMLAKTGSVPYGNSFIVDAPVILYRLNSANRRVSMRFTAQKSGNVNQVRVYVSRAQSSGNVTFRYGLQTDQNDQPSGSWLSWGAARTSSIGWLTVNLVGNAPITAGEIYHLVIQYDSGQQPSNSRYLEIRASSPLNGLYPLDGKADINANCLTYAGAWNPPSGYQPVYLLKFIDNTYEGNPYDNFAISRIYQDNIEGEKFTFSAEEELSGVNLYVSKSRANNPADSLYVKLTDLTDPGNPQVLADEVFLVPTDASTTLSWKTHNFATPIVLSANHTFRLEFYSPGSDNRDYYNVLDVSTPNNAEYIGLTWVGADAIATRSIGGNPFSDLTFVDLAYQLLLRGSAYAQAGELVSSTFNLANPDGAGFNKITWQANIPAKTTVKFKLAANRDNATWHFLGPNGTEAENDNYTAGAGENIYQGFSKEGDLYLRYKVILGGDGTATPTLDRVRINWAK